ncbi:MAG: hypothetical protein ARM1_0222 [Candidatus Micrarchaeota archaeon]|nr:MAG: hypothetical protein ARM1_0222 [Candidatus Micrarchaeota archaeon]
MSEIDEDELRNIISAILRKELESMLADISENDINDLKRILAINDKDYINNPIFRRLNETIARIESRYSKEDQIEESKDEKLFYEVINKNDSVDVIIDLRGFNKALTKLTISNSNIILDGVRNDNKKITKIINLSYRIDPRSIESRFVNGILALSFNKSYEIPRTENEVVLELDKL